MVLALSTESGRIDFREWGHGEPPGPDMSPARGGTRLSWDRATGLGGQRGWLMACLAGPTGAETRP